MYFTTDSSCPLIHRDITTNGTRPDGQVVEEVWIDTGGTKGGGVARVHM